MKDTQRQIQKEQTRRKILNAAYIQFGKKGIMNTRTQDIEKIAKVSHGTIFAHFKTQEELICAVIEDFGGRIGMRTHELAENCSEVEEILKAYLEVIEEYEEFYTRLVIESRLLPKDSRNTYISIQSALSFHLSKALNKEMEEGRIVEMPVYMLFNIWTGLINYYLQNSDLFAPDESVIKRYKDILIDSFMKLIEIKK